MPFSRSVSEFEIDPLHIIASTIWANVDDKSNLSKNIFISFHSISYGCTNMCLDYATVNGVDYDMSMAWLKLYIEI